MRNFPIGRANLSSRYRFSIDFYHTKETTLEISRRKRDGGGGDGGGRVETYPVLIESCSFVMKSAPSSKVVAILTVNNDIALGNDDDVQRNARSRRFFEKVRRHRYRPRCEEIFLGTGNIDAN
jgi:hypothetical protein